LKDGTVTLRDRDTRGQQRVPAAELPSKLAALVRYPPMRNEARAG
ncbi:MAG: hypothetical protein JRM95_03745, partial [Nitrososphaerota archaeon]|nr:hypothetical protein [Nitrososphaerota archaeon]